MDIRGSNKQSAIELVKPDAKCGYRHWAIERHGKMVDTRSWTGTKKPRTTSKACKDDTTAARTFDKAARAKLRDGYVFMGNVQAAQAGDIVFVAFAGGGGGGPVFDLSFDGSIAVTAGLRGAPEAVWLDTIDIRTGVRRRVFERTAKKAQVFLHSACFDESGEAIVLLLGEETLRLDVSSGTTTQLAKYQEDQDASFNPFVVRPHYDRLRKRLVVFDAGTVVRVLGERDEVLLDVPMQHPTTECRGASLSASGELLAVYRVSRGIVYDHEDAKADRTNVIDVWEVATGKLRKTFALVDKVERAGIDGRDELLAVSPDYAQGPVLYDLRTQKELHRFVDPYQSGRLARAFAWDWSPDGSRLAVGRETLCLYDVRDWGNVRDVPLEPSGGFRAQRVQFSGDGTKLATYEDGLMIVRQVG